MKRILALAFAGVIAAVVAGCGGGGPTTTTPPPPPPSQYGGIAFEVGENCAYIVGAITTRQSTRSAAETTADQRCETAARNQAAGASRPGCRATSFSQCAAFAVGTNDARECGGYVRHASSRSSAISDAIDGCESDLAPGADCGILVNACSSSAAPSVEVWDPFPDSPPGPSPTPMPPPPGPGTSTPLRDVNVTIPASCPRQVQVCVRDHECEDGDQIRVSVNGSVIFSGELFNAWNCQNVPVQQGTNRFELFAINGTGFKGNCSHTDANTGEIVVTGGNTRGTQSWRHRGGAGSQANLNVTVGPAGGTCTPTGSEPGSNTGPGTGTRLYGAVANAFHSQCQGRATGMSSGHSDLASAESRALQECQSRRSSGLPGCTVIARFGSAYQGNHQCAAVAYGERTSGNVTSCKLRVGTGSTESAAQSDALSDCRSGGYRCSVEPSDTGGLLSACAQ